MHLIIKCWPESPKRVISIKEKMDSMTLKIWMNHILFGRERKKSLESYLSLEALSGFPFSMQSKLLRVLVLKTFVGPCQRYLFFTFLGIWQRKVTSFSQLHSIFSHLENALMFVTCTINKSKKANPSVEQCHMKLN